MSPALARLSHLSCQYSMGSGTTRPSYQPPGYTGPPYSRQNKHPKSRRSGWYIYVYDVSH